VNGALWHYTQSARLAAEEDTYFAGHPLFVADRVALDARFVVPGKLVDLGCGTGRHSLRFARKGFSVTAVELSQAMLETVGYKAAGSDVRLVRVRANLCDLGCFRSGEFDYALSTFSTLGMIRGRDARRRALAEACRILVPGGRLALHAHNVWLNLRTAQGRAWLAGELRQLALLRPEFGDREMTYRGIPGMKVHLFRWGELRADLRRAGFRIEEVIAIDAVQARPIAMPWCFHGLRAGGWILFARKPE
jgi:SAM-dependent methyltransferase